MRTFFKVVSILNIIAVLFICIAILAVFFNLNSDVGGLNWDVIKPFTLVSGFIILLGSISNFMMGLSKEHWQTVEKLQYNIQLYIDAKKKVLKQENLLAQAVLEKNMENHKYQQGYDDGYQRKSNEVAHHKITE